MARTALITGASSGFGAEYARQLAARGMDLVLVSPEAAALVALAEGLRGAHAVRVEVIAADLLHADQLDTVIRRLTDAARPVDMLVNSAGFGLTHGFELNDVRDEVRHLHLHVEVPLRLMHEALRPMLQRGSGRIVTVASVAAFVPWGTYGACKAWLVSFSRWANGKYSGRGVTFTAVCPGFTHTDFHVRMGMPRGDEGVPGWMWLDAGSVVRESLRDVARGRGLSVPSWRYKALLGLTRVLPVRLLAVLGRQGA
jgi:short-subunit dehydrogenase